MHASIAKFPRYFQGPLARDALKYLGLHEPQILKQSLPGTAEFQLLPLQTHAKSQASGGFEMKQ